MSDKKRFIILLDEKQRWKNEPGSHYGSATLLIHNQTAQFNRLQPKHVSFSLSVFAFQCFTGKLSRNPREAGPTRAEPFFTFSPQ